MEIFEREGHLVVRADLPGLTEDDVHVEVTDEALTIEGERRSEHEERQGGVFRSERRYGAFRRQIPLPEGVNADQVTASFKDGVLESRCPSRNSRHVAIGSRFKWCSSPSGIPVAQGSKRRGARIKSTHGQRQGEPDLDWA